MNIREKMVRPEGLELSTFWFVAVGSNNINCFFGVACEPRARFYPFQLSVDRP
jgi:hypothetical protein